MSLPYKPDYAVPPGATITETLEANKKTITDLAQATNETVDYITDIIEARLPITEDLARKFEGFFKIPASFWLNAQDNYDATTYRLFWERCRKKPNLFTHLTDGQMDALQALLQCVDEDGMPSREEDNAVEFYKDVDFIEEEFNAEFVKRFFPDGWKEK